MACPFSCHISCNSMFLCISRWHFMHNGITRPNLIESCLFRPKNTSWRLSFFLPQIIQCSKSSVNMLFLLVSALDNLYVLFFIVLISLYSIVLHFLQNRDTSFLYLVQYPYFLYFFVFLSKK